MTITRSRPVTPGHGLNCLQTITRWKSWSAATWRARRNLLARGLSALALAYALGAGCGRCGGSLSVSGDSPYARCRGGESPTVSQAHFGSLTFRMQQRTFEISGLQRPALIAAFAGPGPGPAPSRNTLATLASDKPSLLFVLGDLGDRDDVARATVAALAATGIPTIVVAGARDTPARLAAARDASGHVLDATALDGVRIGDDTFIPLAGTHLGRYAAAADNCGFGADDLAALTKAYGPRKGGRRWLLSWQAPSGGVAANAVDAGDPEIQRFAQAIGATGGLFAWPAVQAGRAFGSEHRAVIPPAAPSASDLQLIVPRIGPPALERGDGSRLLPGYALLRLDGSGLQLVALRNPP